MIAAIDNTILTLLINPSAKAASDPRTNLPTPDIKLKLLSMLDDLSASNARLIVPTPAIGEALCVATPANEILDKLNSFTCIDPQAFGMRAAMEMADVVKANRTGIKKIQADATRPWQHIKMDLMIVGVAIASKATRIYSDDKSQSRFAELAGLEVVHSWDLQITGKYQQKNLFEGEGDE